METQKQITDTIWRKNLPIIGEREITLGDKISFWKGCSCKTLKVNGKVTGFYGKRFPKKAQEMVGECK